MFNNFNMGEKEQEQKEEKVKQFPLFFFISNIQV